MPARIDVHMFEEWVIVDEVDTKSREILSLLIQAAGFKVCTSRYNENVWYFLPHVGRYVSYHPSLGLVSTNTYFKSTIIVEYDQVMHKLKNIIENNSKKLWTLEKDGK